VWHRVCDTTPTGVENGSENKKAINLPRFSLTVTVTKTNLLLWLSAESRSLTTIFAVFSTLIYPQPPSSEKHNPSHQPKRRATVFFSFLLLVFPSFFLQKFLAKMNIPLKKQRNFIGQSKTSYHFNRRRMFFVSVLANENAIVGGRRAPYSVKSLPRRVSTATFTRVRRCFHCAGSISDKREVANSTAARRVAMDKASREMEGEMKLPGVMRSSANDHVAVTRLEYGPIHSRTQAMQRSKLKHGKLQPLVGCASKTSTKGTIGPGRRPLAYLL